MKSLTIIIPQNFIPQFSLQLGLKLFDSKLTSKKVIGESDDFMSTFSNVKEINLVDLGIYKDGRVNYS